MNSSIKIPLPVNEPIWSYAPGTAPRKELKEQLQKMLSDRIEIPLVIGGREIRTGDLGDCRCPHDREHLLGQYHKAGPVEVEMAVEASRRAWRDWSEMDWVSRASIFLKAAELLATKYRYILNGATMLGQSKTAYQAEIDSACELIDFYRFNPYFMAQIYGQQPESSPGTWNYVDYRALEGFVFAVTPFNFTSIAGNLPAAPALMGNTVLWKPASSAVYSAYFVTRLWAEAGLPDGVINFIPGSGAGVGTPVLEKTDLAGIHFTGSTAVFSGMWKFVGDHIRAYKSYPRLVGETGGKDFVFIHASADVDAAATALIRGAFEYQGQKCSAASRAYIPQSLWPSIRERLLDEIRTIRMGDITDFSNFMGAVIDKTAFDTIVGYLEYARKSPEAEILIGGGCDDSRGYFIETHGGPHHQPAFQADDGRDLRPRADRVCIRRRGLRRHAGTVPHRIGLCSYGRRYGHRPRGRHPGERGAEACRRELLHKRQTDRGRGRPATLRRRRGLGHERQGRFPHQFAPMDERPGGEGDLPSARGLQVSVHEREIADIAFPEETVANRALQTRIPAGTRKAYGKRNFEPREERKPYGSAVFHQPGKHLRRSQLQTSRRGPGKRRGDLGLGRGGKALHGLSVLVFGRQPGALPSQNPGRRRRAGEKTDPDFPGLPKRSARPVL